MIVTPLGRQKAKSSYVNSLDAEAKRRYCEKLSSVGLSTTDDPYLPANVGKYANDMTTWPKIEYGNIFGYFITRPDTRTAPFVEADGCI